MDYFDAVITRSPIKKYERKEVDDKLIGVILYMANHAENAGNLQAWEFIVVKDEEKKKQLSEAALRLNIVKEAPVCIVVCADLRKMSLKYQERGEHVYAVQDTASAITIMSVTAQFLGLGTNWIRAFDEDKVKQILGIPPDLRPLGIVTVGHPFEKSTISKLQPIENITWLDFYKKKYNIAYMFQAGATEEVFEPIVDQIMDKLRKRKLHS